MLAPRRLAVADERPALLLAGLDAGERAQLLRLLQARSPTDGRAPERYRQDRPRAERPEDLQAAPWPPPMARAGCRCRRSTSGRRFPSMATCASG